MSEKCLKWRRFCERITGYPETIPLVHEEFGYRQLRVVRCPPRLNLPLTPSYVRTTRGQ